MPPLTLTPELAEAIESLYGAFQGYPLHMTTNPCICCHSLEDERPLHSKPLRALTAKDLFWYAMDAVLVWGDPDDFRHFLPRIFELVVSADDRTFADREIVFSKLYHAEWRYWPAMEQKAVEEFLLALWRAVLEAGPGDAPYGADQLESWLCAIAQAETDLSPYLREWLRSSTAAAAWNLAAAITRACTRSANSFWRGHETHLQQVSDWLRSDNVRKKLEAAMETFINEPFSEELFSALLLLS